MSCPPPAPPAAPFCLSGGRANQPHSEGPPGLNCLKMSALTHWPGHLGEEEDQALGVPDSSENGGGVVLYSWLDYFPSSWHSRVPAQLHTCLELLTELHSTPTCFFILTGETFRGRCGPLPFFQIASENPTAYILCTITYLITPC